MDDFINRRLDVVEIRLIELEKNTAVFTNIITKLDCTMEKLDESLKIINLNINTLNSKVDANGIGLSKLEGKFERDADAHKFDFVNFVKNQFPAVIIFLYLIIEKLTPTHIP